MLASLCETYQVNSGELGEEATDVGDDLARVLHHRLTALIAHPPKVKISERQNIAKTSQPQYNAPEAGKS